MYCSHCGQAIESQPYCPKCGAPTGVVPQGAAVPLSPVSKVVRHLRILGILWVVYAVYLTVSWLLILPLLRAWAGGQTLWMNGSDTWIYAPFHPSSWLLHFIAFMVLIRIVLSLMVGYALLTRQRWGRTFAIVIAIITLIKPLWGTLLAIYTLWVLIGGNAGPEYDRLAAAANQFSVDASGARS